MKRTIVILVDHKIRDLPINVLLNMKLEKMGFRVVLLPLESYRSCLSSYKPDLILFNHLLAGHLVAFSKRLKELGVGVAALHNEGLAYEEETNEFLAGKSHPAAQIDLYFCWNLKQEKLVRSNYEYAPSLVKAVGNPRFDFLFPPFFNREKNKVKSNKQVNVLVVSNLGLADFYHAEKDVVDTFFAMWSKTNPLYKDYWGAIELHYKTRLKQFEFLDELISDGKYKVILRPHPKEDLLCYEEWIKTLNVEKLKNIEINKSKDFHRLLEDCDVELSYHRCTTALECWIAGKPTIELPLLGTHPMLVSKYRLGMSPELQQPSDVHSFIKEALDDPGQQSYKLKRELHLKEWLNSPSGKSTDDISSCISDWLDSRSTKPNFLKLTLKEKLRGAKQKIYDFIGVPLTWSPFIKIRYKINPEKNLMRLREYEKAITAKDVMSMKKYIDGVLNK